MSLKLAREENQTVTLLWQRVQTLLGALNPQKSQPSTSEGNTHASSAKKERIGLTLLQRLELHSSGLPAGDSVKILGQRLSQPELKTLAQSLWRDLSEGSTLANALARQPNYFNRSSTHVIEAGEATGNLVPILTKVIDYLEEKTSHPPKDGRKYAVPCIYLLGCSRGGHSFLTVPAANSRNA